MTGFPEIKTALDEMSGAHRAFFARTQKTLDEYGEAINDLRDRVEDREAKAGRPFAPASARSFTTRDQKEHLDTFAAWLRKPRSAELKQRLENIESKVASGLSDSAGGAIVPEILVDQIIAQVKDGSAMRQIARVVPVTSGDIKFPVSVNDASSAWVGETATRNATSEPTFIERKPTVGTVYSYISASEELVFDARFPVAEWFSQSVADEIVKSEGAAFISGNGVDKPTGLLNTAPESSDDDASPARTATALQYFPTGAAAGFDSDPYSSPPGRPDDVLFDAVYGLKAQYRRRAVWLMNSSTAGVVRKWKDADGRSLWADPLAEGQPALLAGYRVMIDEAMPDIGTDAHPVLFGDFMAGYGIFDAGGLRVTLDDNITQPGRLRWYIRKRVGGIVLDHNAVKAVKCAAS